MSVIFPAGKGAIKRSLLISEDAAVPMGIRHIILQAELLHELRTVRIANIVRRIVDLVRRILPAVEFHMNLAADDITLAFNFRCSRSIGEGIVSPVVAQGELILNLLPCSRFLCLAWISRRIFIEELRIINLDANTILRHQFSAPLIRRDLHLVCGDIDGLVVDLGDISGFCNHLSRRNLRLDGRIRILVILQMDVLAIIEIGIQSLVIIVDSDAVRHEIFERPASAQRVDDILVICHRAVRFASDILGVILRGLIPCLVHVIVERDDFFSAALLVQLQLKLKLVLEFPILLRLRHEGRLRTVVLLIEARAIPDFLDVRYVLRAYRTFAVRPVLDEVVLRLRLHRRIPVLDVFKRILEVAVLYIARYDAAISIALDIRVGIEVSLVPVIVTILGCEQAARCLVELEILSGNPGLECHIATVTLHRLGARSAVIHPVRITNLCGKLLLIDVAFTDDAGLPAAIQGVRLHGAADERVVVCVVTRQMDRVGHLLRSSEPSADIAVCIARVVARQRFIAIDVLSVKICGVDSYAIQKAAIPILLLILDDILDIEVRVGLLVAIGIVVVAADVCRTVVNLAHGSDREIDLARIDLTVLSGSRIRILVMTIAVRIERLLTSLQLRLIEIREIEVVAVERELEVDVLVVHDISSGVALDILVRIRSIQNLGQVRIHINRLRTIIIITDAQRASHIGTEVILDILRNIRRTVVSLLYFGTREIHMKIGIVLNQTLLDSALTINIIAAVLRLKLLAAIADRIILGGLPAHAEGDVRIGNRFPLQRSIGLHP